MEIVIDISDKERQQLEGTIGNIDAESEYDVIYTIYSLIENCM